MDAATAAGKPPLHSSRLLRRSYFNRVFAAVYFSAILALIYRHVISLIHSKTLSSISISISLLFADLLLAFMWFTSQSCRLNMIVREVYLENLKKVIALKEDFPGLDIFICTADPYKEPPLNVVNTALSVMAYDFPPEKMSVYVSDDGGSELTLFAFMEAAKFGRSWLPFCKRNHVMDRCPDAFFRSINYSSSSETQHIKDMYESMKEKIECVMEKGKVTDEYITSEEEREAFSQWKKQGIFTRQQHPSVIQVLLERDKDKDTSGNSMPNLIYVSREKSKASYHNFKAGALNTLLRVSAIMTNAPIILTLDCDMYSNDPETAQRVICFMMDPQDLLKLGYVQFPQKYHGLNKADIYAAEFTQALQINVLGMDGLRGPNHVGTGCFFNRRVFFGGPSSFVQPEIPELNPDFSARKPITAPSILNLAHHVAGCNYEKHTNWGSKIGFKYGTLVEDFYTGYLLQCEGWYSVFYHPKRAAFLGDIPITLIDVITQHRRWFVGFLDVAFSKHSPLTYGVRTTGFSHSSIYAHYSLWAIWSIPITIYTFIPQLAMLNNVSIFPKVSDRWFLLYSFLFLGAYGRQCLDFIQAHSTFERWWNDQRFWLIRGHTSYSFATIEFIAKILGVDASKGFNLTSKVVDDEQGKRYDQGIFEFGVASPMFVPLSMAAILNLVAFLYGFLKINSDGMFVQMFIAGFGVLNSLPIYEAMVLRSDKGRMPTKITIISAILTLGLYIISSFVVKI